jgi:hypothetical protein
MDNDISKNEEYDPKVVESIAPIASISRVSRPLSEAILE